MDDWPRWLDRLLNWIDDHPWWSFTIFFAGSSAVSVALVIR